MRANDLCWGMSVKEIRHARFAEYARVHGADWRQLEGQVAACNRGKKPKAFLRPFRKHCTKVLLEWQFAARTRLRLTTCTNSTSEEVMELKVFIDMADDELQVRRQGIS